MSLLAPAFLGRGWLMPTVTVDELLVLPKGTAPDPGAGGGVSDECPARGGRGGVPGLPGVRRGGDGGD